VVGFANSVLLTQEFTSDVVRISHGINHRLGCGRLRCRETRH
jgi:hypothetical protein